MLLGMIALMFQSAKYSSLMIAWRCDQQRIAYPTRSNAKRLNLPIIICKRNKTIAPFYTFLVTPCCYVMLFDSLAHVSTTEEQKQSIAINKNNFILKKTMI